MKGRKKEHEWDYMGRDIEKGVEYGFCELCGKYIATSDTTKTITKEQYLERWNAGMIKGMD
jgi:hypothetical protein